MMSATMPNHNGSTREPDSVPAPRPEPAPNSPLARPPDRPAKPEYDQRGITPGQIERGHSRRAERR